MADLTGTATEAPSGDDDDFDIVFEGLRVLVSLRPRSVEAPPLTADAVIRVLQEAPPLAVDRVAIESALSVAASTFHVGDVAVPPGCKDAYCVLVAPSRLAAYVVPVSNAGEDNPTPIGSDALRALIATAHVVSGLLDDVIDDCGDGSVIEHVTCIARGIAVTPCVDARIEHHFESDLDLTPTEHADGRLDYRALHMQRFVDEGTPVLTRHPATLGIDGLDVFGTVVPATPARDVEIASIAGPNTRVEGNTILAAITGRPLLRGNIVELLPVFDVAGDLDYTVGNIDFPGDVIIRGDVKPGFTIVAGGSVVVSGLVEGASISTEHDLAVMGTVGEHRSTFTVGGNLTARYLHTTEATITGAANVATEIVNCTLTAQRVTTAQNGRIVGGAVTATDEVDTGSIGSREETVMKVCVTSSDPAAVIRARRDAHPGVQFEIAEARRTIRDATGPASFWRTGEAIVALKPGVDAATAQEAREPAPVEELPPAA